MKRIVPAFLLFLLLTVSAAAKDRAAMIVTTAWLSEHLNDKSLVLLHVGDRKEYDVGHLPGAQFISTRDISTPQEPGRLILEMPAIEQLKEAFEKLGVSNDSRIVIYFGRDWVSPAARVWFTLEYLGLGDQTSMLDGGMPAWKAENRPLTAEIRTPVRGSLTPKPKKELIADAVWLRSNLNKPKVAIIDSRLPRFYEGTDPGSMPRAGHIPGAMNVPFTSLVTEPGLKFKDKAALSSLYKNAGADAGDTVVTYCHIGQQASLGYFVAKYLGYTARLYDGSFDEWSRHADWPVEGSKAAETPKQK